MINAHPFPIFEAPTLRRSLATLRAPQVDEHRYVESFRKKIFGPLCDAIVGAPAERLAMGRRNNDTVFAIAAGDQLFPIVKASGGRISETWIFPPLARDRVNADTLREATSAFSDMSSLRQPSWKQEEMRSAALDKWLAAFYSGQRPQPASIYVKDNHASLMSGSDLIEEGPFAKEAFSVVDLLLRTARQPQTVAEKGFLGNLFSFGSSTSRSRSLSVELRNLCAPRLKATEAAGPPRGLADDLCDAAVWRDRIVLLTSQRTQGGRTRLWIEDSVNGRSCFREIQTPKTLAPNGVTMLVTDDEVRLFGGAHRDGDTTADTFVYPLSTALHSGFEPDYWRTGTPMAQPAAWPVVAMVNRDLYVLDGVSKLVQESKGDDLRMPIVERSFRRLQNKWMERSAPPEDTTGASIASDRRVIVVGPGNRRDGKLYLCDTAQGEKWYQLPPLPIQVGMGQVFLSEDKITYVAGFDAQGKPNKEVYQLDLNGLSGRWEHVGSSNYAGGAACVVQRKGQLCAIMVTPTASRVYQIG